MIEVRNLTKSYLVRDKRHYVFKDVCFKFPEKTNIGIIGRNREVVPNLGHVFC